MINSAYYDKPLVFIGATLDELYLILAYLSFEYPIQPSKLIDNQARQVDLVSLEMRLDCVVIRG